MFDNLVETKHVWGGQSPQKMFRPNVRHEGIGLVIKLFGSSGVSDLFSAGNPCFINYKRKQRNNIKLSVLHSTK